MPPPTCIQLCIQTANGSIAIALLTALGELYATTGTPPFLGQVASDFSQARGELEDNLNAATNESERAIAFAGFLAAVAASGAWLAQQAGVNPPDIATIFGNLADRIRQIAEDLEKCIKDCGS